MSENFARLERSIGYEFTSESLLELALTHRSLGHLNNERLEFLGDSLLNMVIAEYLYRQFPKLKEGQMSRQRAGLVRGTTLAEIAREFKLGDYILLGSGELKSGGFRRDSILADAVESIIGAIYLDSGFEVCRERILAWYERRLDALSDKGIQKDSKTRLQEFLQSRQEPLPNYVVVNVTGEAHAQTFYVDCEVSLLNEKTSGEGNSRRIAEQTAARNALVLLGIESAV
ncbi:MAG: ribonuclease III [Hahellaceae bacterium]|nr:ribonuclease III [Hahellaceae bacterium]MCP5212373.1 ribonuclease III [Hahellaceae bacterium]